ncbi:MAG: hypothetical protein Q7R73_04300 [bacterium]|nr:hypothetical protein [bacterium]
MDKVAGIKINEKISGANDIIRRCIGKNGLWAGPARYRYQCWTRDLVIAGIDALFSIGRSDVVRKHLEVLAKKQRANGQIPIQFIDNLPRWLLRKVIKTILSLRTSFMLARWFVGVMGLQRGISVEILTPWTKDSEILFCIGVLEYAEKTGDTAFRARYQKNIDSAIRFIERELVKDGLVYGGDWRDTMEHLGEKAILTNNVFLYRLYALSGNSGKALALKTKINTEFWNGFFYRDWIGGDDFDTFGQALAVLYDIVPPERYPNILQKFSSVRKHYGYMTNDVVPAPTSRAEAAVIATTNQFSVLWPFINGFVLLAMTKMGIREEAGRAFLLWTKLHGFYEWYDPHTGKGYGESEQVWSAALYLRCARELAQ